jgi:hypothetical protein
MVLSLWQKEDSLATMAALLIRYGSERDDTIQGKMSICRAAAFDGYTAKEVDGSNI